MKLPVYTWLRGYDRGWIRGDVIAGLTVWAVLVPEALADATIAGVSPVVGLYAAPGALLLYAAFGSSRQLVVGLKMVAPVVPGSLVAAGRHRRRAPVPPRQARRRDRRQHRERAPFLRASGCRPLGLPRRRARGLGRDADRFRGRARRGQAYAARDNYEIGANRELLGLGAASIGSGLSSGMLVNGSLSKTAVNAGAGAKSQLSSLVVAVLIVVTLLFLTGLFEERPEAVLAIRAKAGGPGRHGRRARAETIRAIDFTAAHMLIELGRDLQRQGKRLVLARQVGQVPDILATEQGPRAIEIYPSARAAVDALRAESQTEA